MKSFWHFMVVKFVHKCIFALIALFACSFVLAEECASNFDVDRASERPGLLFDEIVTPILDGYVYRPTGEDRVYIDSHTCRNTVQNISIVDLTDCILCNAAVEELKQAGFEFIDAGEGGSRSFRFLINNGQTVLVVWNLEKALKIKDQNYDYLLYVVNLYFD